MRDGGVRRLADTNFHNPTGSYSFPSAPRKPREPKPGRHWDHLCRDPGLVEVLRHSWFAYSGVAELSTKSVWQFANFKIVSQFVVAVMTI